jgi:4,5-DOPA dioxygenase extradiol
MQRKKFIQIMAGVTGAITLSQFQGITDAMSIEDEKMPVLFVGHGSPMNALEDNEFSRNWRTLGTSLPKPKAILCVSAHWLTRGTHVTAMEKPRTIHDFGGFPRELFEAQYPAPGSPEVARETAALFSDIQVGLDTEWGLDHGCWSVLRQMFPQADIPVLQLSIDYHQPPAYHYALAKHLSALRRKGILIVGSGNMVHNLGMIAWNMPDKGFDWAEEMNTLFKEHISDGNHQPLLDYQQFGRAAQLAIPTPDHYYPLLYTLGLQEKNEKISFFNDKAMMGSLTMTSVQIGG